MAAEGARTQARVVSISTALGREREVALPGGRVRYRDTGSGEPLVFVHGVFCNGDLWRKVVPILAGDYRCIVPDWPLGSHYPPFAKNADLTPTGIAALILDFVEALGLEQPTLIGNDTGGAFVQLAAAVAPERLARIVLTSCDAFENFPPVALRLPAKLGYSPRGMFLLGQLLRPRRVQRLMYRWSTKGHLPDDVCDSYARHGLRHPAVVRDLARVLRELHPRYTLTAAEALRRFDRPALVAWAGDDRFFPPDHGRRLAALMPRARFELVEDSRTFIPEDQPDRLASLIRGFVTEHPLEHGGVIAGGV